ncbi:hypothetical protein SPRG_15698 [Saprolegnia parasitica CBS 223.65]|uniref:Uncharacterized protein n=1 Tax=Saprolegnia parasitica (strain CBS 223.65) TaxID=695850 RepID=A0A067BQ20_SAPPC|nr:hypothetical protein SPRG_15698 [Saprolegnia parasitica CBS 223.65]KDO18870.1 hypothetical protein SPRG_15698 [Saprolegnia parasitica CBS 223.65]|eukprot:XP_012210424.1 hypothetical protein SPRG_15698 [Saprolegnia parasitica CBS 223.65]
MQLASLLLVVAATALVAADHKRTKGAPDVFDMFDGGNLEGGMVGGVEGGVAARVNLVHDDVMLRNHGDGLDAVPYNTSAVNGAQWIYNPSWQLFLNNRDNKLTCLDAFKGNNGELYVHTYGCAKWDSSASEASASNQLWSADPMANLTTIEHVMHTGFCLSQSGKDKVHMKPCNASDPAQLFELRDVPK